MNTYAQRWMRAVALKQGYDTGAVESSGVVLVDPLTGNFTITKEKWNSLNEQGDKMWPYVGGAAAAALVVGIIAGRLSKGKS